MHELISDKLLYQDNKYAAGKRQEKYYPQLPLESEIKSQRVLPKEIYPDKDVMAIFNAILNLDHPIR